MKVSAMSREPRCAANRGEFMRAKPEAARRIG